MSNELESTMDEVCASCGDAGIDDVKLKQCACKLLKYCSVDCQKNHRPQHKKACKKRLGEIRDDNLFQQPDGSHHGECPICCLPLPLDDDKRTMNSCCSKTICFGCSYANQKREIEKRLERKCAFCREPVPTTQVGSKKMAMERVKANDPVALSEMGKTRYHEGDYEGAVEYNAKAAALGDIDAHYHLSCLYHEGEGVEKDIKKEVYHLEEAAIGGHPSARFNLGNHEGRNGRIDRMVKHWIIAAKQGHDDALEAVKENFRRGYVSKDDSVSALRGHQVAVDATKSEQRTKAYAFRNTGN